jgi:purine-binding chemotaxis protein CheW
MGQDRRVPPGHVGATPRDASPEIAPATGSELLVFRAGPERFALAVAGLESVIDMPPVRPLPGMPMGMIGVAELRGSLVPVYSPARVLNVSIDDPTAAIIVRTDQRGSAGTGRRIAIAVSAAEGVTAFDPGAWSGVGGPTPRTGLVRGVATWEGYLTTLVDATAFVAACIEGSPAEAA